jgi:hypothetical protein
MRARIIAAMKKNRKGWFRLCQVHHHELPTRSKNISKSDFTKSCPQWPQWPQWSKYWSCVPYWVMDGDGQRPDT